MNHIFVWRLEDVFSIVFLAIVVAVGLVYMTAVGIDRIKRYFGSRKR